MSTETQLLQTPKNPRMPVRVARGFMHRRLGFLVLIAAVPSIQAQPCPSINLFQGSTVNVFEASSFAAGLQRQPDGSYTRHRYKVTSPYSKIDSTPNFQSNFLTCSPAGPRTFRTPAGWQPL